jgi:signal transduction histidine kinase
VTAHLRALRLRLTAWFTLANVGIFLLMGAGLLWAIHRELDRELERVLDETVTESIRGARVLAADGTAPLTSVVQAAAEFRTPIRPVLVYGPDGTLSAGEAAPSADAVARAARRVGQADGRFVAADGTTWWAHAERFDVGDDGPFVEMALENGEPLERQYRHMVEAFIAAGLAAAMLAGAGGYRLSRVSAKPVEESMERTRRLVADLAHELRTPLAVVRAHVDVSLRRERDPGDYADTLRLVGREAERLGHITDDLLLLARADAGQRPVARQPLFLDDVAADAVAAAGALADSRGVRLGMDRYEETPVVGDPELLRRLTMILLDNAVHFTPRDRCVTVDVHPEAERAVLVVRDEGEGIPPEALERVFERFFRVDGARGRVGGAGLGLSIARWVATEHGGVLALESAPGEGVRATLRLPLSL